MRGRMRVHNYKERQSHFRKASSPKAGIQQSPRKKELKPGLPCLIECHNHEAGYQATRPESKQKVEQNKRNWTDPTGQTEKQMYRAWLQLSGRSAQKGCNTNSNTCFSESSNEWFNYPMKWKSCSGGKKSVWKENKSYMFKSMRCGNAPEMALFPITFECMSYQALNLYYVCYIDFAF